MPRRNYQKHHRLSRLERRIGKAVQRAYLATLADQYATYSIDEIYAHQTDPYDAGTEAATEEETA